MAFDLQEQEQIDALKAFWQRWGVTVTAVVVAALLGTIGVQGWRWYQQRQAESAAALYGQMEALAAKGDTVKLVAAAEPIKQDYPRTAYASRAALAAARAAYETGDAKTARTQLGWVVEHASEDSLKAVARLRLATLAIDAKQYDEALALLTTEHDPAFAGLFLDARGDALSAKGDTAAARSAYRDALAKTPADAANRPYLQIKLDALGGES